MMRTVDHFVFLTHYQILRNENFYIDIALLEDHFRDDKAQTKETLGSGTYRANTSSPQPLT